ncbi:MAG TPA: hypothetical protein DCL54_11165 [Alphaproteobacteria bacterium]|nr:hypothetical protein [Alphaproteobacteria bacterium]HAJ47126.1 hypothetical protein [Alphaproteobacteria bacterium]
MKHLLDDSRRRYLFEYRHEGAEWALEIRARNLDDARGRLKAMAWAQYRGEIEHSGTIPGGGFLLRITRLLQHFTGNKKESSRKI